MNKLLRLKKAIASLVVAGVVIPTLSHSVSAYAQADANKELALWAIAAQARDEGDLATAKAKLEEILALNPNATAARDTLASVNRELGAVRQDAAAQTSLGRVAQKYDSINDEVRAAMFEAEAAAKAGDTAHAIQLLDRASASLPDSVGSEELRNNISLQRQRIITASANGVGTADRAIADKVAELGLAQREALGHTDAARRLLAQNKLDDAQKELDQAVKLQRAVATERTHAQIRQVQAELLQERIFGAIEARDFVSADRYLSDFGKLQGEESKSYLRMKETVDAYRADPRYQAITSASPKFPAQEQKVAELLTRARAQYLYGDYEGAATTYKEVLQYQSYNTQAKQMLLRIQKVLMSSSSQNKELFKEEMLTMVDEKWLWARVFDHEDKPLVGPPVNDPTEEKLKGIVFPTITLRDAPLSKAIETLAALSASFDPEGKGVNMVTILGSDQNNPVVSLQMRDISLEKILDFVCRTSGFRYEIEDGIIEVTPGIGNGNSETREFKVVSETVQKITGRGGRRSTDAGAGAGSVWGTSTGGGVGAGVEDEASVDEAALKNYFQRFGILFDNPQYGLTYNGTDTLVVTHTARNLERIYRILQEKGDVGTKQVSIETKFIDVSQGALRQLSTNWVVSRPDGNGGTSIRAQSGLRTLNSAFGSEKASSPGQISRVGSNAEQFSNTAPDLNAQNMGPDFSTFSGVIGSIGNWDLELLISAIEENEGSDLMAAPSVTVMDGGLATIRIAQELIFPSEYDQVQANVGTGSGDAGTGASVAITAGTPQFEGADQDDNGIWHVGPYREVGVVLQVTPEVSDEDQSIKLDLKPRITEFEGFVEYGGTSVAIAGDTTVTVPSGFFMPVFSIRQVETIVRIYDGATVIIGGLTREETKTVSDKIPVLGDLPLIGAAFRSEGKATTKRNLMIFVTASLITPGGSPLNASIGNVRAGSTFSNPKVLTPGGNVSREVVSTEAVSGR